MQIDTDDPSSGNTEASSSGKATEESNKRPKVILESIEPQDTSKDGEDGVFKPEPKPNSDYDNRSDADSDGFDDDSDYGSDADSGVFVDSDHDKALYTPPGTMPGKDVKSVGWSGGRSRRYINMYGKKSGARYRLEGLAFPAEYEDSRPEKEQVSNPKNRYGDELSDSGKPKYTRRHIRGIFGVAWKAAGPRVSRHDLECINPEFVDNWRDVPTYVLIAWDINGEIQKTWETRACLRKRWGKKDADIAIYEAAVEAEDRYMQVKTGRRPAKSRSPSVGLAQGHVHKHREKSLGVGRSSSSRSARTTRASKSPQRGTKALEELRQEFLDNYLELLGAGEFTDLDMSERRDCVNAWKEEKKLYFLA
ncbi:hypothetical protein CEP54_014978 [Fusarium duplospermum]|uniref:Uncharacterized protein n=1 Tax=Fusarium duplospermum TaxID=1325734 RepID=A0A428NSF2_9HYPO|nr:hypothetical protein CEP54_014978 [Fusarium duplospermum]